MQYIYKEIFVYGVILNWKANNWIIRNTESSRTPPQHLSPQLTDRPHPRATKLSFGRRDAPSQMTYSSDGTYWRSKTGTRASVHYTDGRLTTRSHEALKPRDLDLNFSNRSEIWRSQQRCRDACYSIHLLWWLLKWLNSITTPGSVSNEPGSVTWLATEYLKNPCCQLEKPHWKN